MIRFFVQGIPKAMSVGGRAVKNPKTGQLFVTRRNEEWGSLVGAVGRQYAPDAPLLGPVSMLVRFWIPRPKKHQLFPITRPDLDNVTHKLSDQFNGVFWADDAQLVDCVQRKRYVENGGQTGVEVVVVRGPLTMLVCGSVDGAVLVQDD